jgi:SAM-dependent methyltransferase
MTIDQILTLQQLLKQKPKLAPYVFRYIDKNFAELDDFFLDSLLGVKPKTGEKQFNLTEATKMFGYEQYTYEGTPYEFIRLFLHVFKPDRKDIVYDLGSGYGRVVLYGALTTDSAFRGLEIVSSRIEQANDIKDRLKISNAEFILANARNFDFWDGTIFFLFNPFSSETLSIVGDKLKQISNTKTIKIATWGGSSNLYFQDQLWLQKINLASFSHHRIDYFQSK